MRHGYGRRAGSCRITPSDSHAGIGRAGKGVSTQSSFKCCADPASWMVWGKFLSSLGGSYKLNQTQVIASGKVWGFLRFFVGRGTDF